MFDLAAYRALRDANLLAGYREEAERRRDELTRLTNRYDADCQAAESHFQRRLGTLETLGLSPLQHQKQQSRARAEFNMELAGYRAAILHERCEIRRLEQLYNDLLHQQPMDKEFA